MGFYTDWFFLATCLATNAILLLASGSIYVGIILYINGMGKDMNARILTIERDSEVEESPRSAWSIYLQEINMHAEIIQ